MRFPARGEDRACRSVPAVTRGGDFGRKAGASRRGDRDKARGTDYAAALEASLKLKEISYIHSDAYQSGELKHGPIALIEDDVTVVRIINDRRLVEKSVSNLQEVITRGAKTLIITNQILPNSHFDYVINIPETNPLISPIFIE